MPSRPLHLLTKEVFMPLGCIVPVSGTLLLMLVYFLS